MTEVSHRFDLKLGLLAMNTANEASHYTTK